MSLIVLHFSLVDQRICGVSRDIGAEHRVDRGEAPHASRIARLKTCGALFAPHIDDICNLGKAPLRSKAATLELLKRQLGKCNMASLDRERLIRFGRDRAAQGAGPVTVGIDIGMIKLILAHAAAVHGPPVKVEPIDLARIALKRLGLVGKGHERDRRPTQEELDRLISTSMAIPANWPVSLETFPLYHFVAAIIYAQLGMKPEAVKAREQFLRMRPKIFDNWEQEMAKRNYRPEDAIHLAEGARKAGFPVPARTVAEAALQVGIPQR